MIHISFNLIGTAVGLLVICGGGLLFDMPFLTQPVNAVGVALCHTVFNVCTTILLLPFTRQLEALAKRVISTSPPTLPFWTPGCCGRPAWLSVSARL